jgi:ketosteroid isomerase-like protein
MSESNREVIRRFFDYLNSGTPDMAMFTPDWTVWTLGTRSDSPGQEDLEGNRLLMALFPRGLDYKVESTLVDGDRAAARVKAQGTLGNGDEYHNDYVFLFELRDGLIARIEEFYDTAPVAAKLMPLLMEARAAKEA